MKDRFASILLVEDDPNDVLLIRRAFHKAQLRTPIQVVSDGEEAIAYLSHQGLYSDRDRYPFPDLILLDLKLPRRSGLEVLEWIRQHPYLKQLIVVVLTSSQETPDMEKAYSLGVNSYLIKPVTFQSLVHLIQMVNQYWFDLNQLPIISHEW